MLEITKALKTHMKESQKNMESLSKSELLMLFSVLEGELEARDVVIEALRAQCRDSYVEVRYGKYNLSDPFLALQRDSEALGVQDPGVHQAAAQASPLTVLKLVVTHCRRMQEKMLAQLAAAERRHRKVIADLEEERRRHAEDTAEGDDVTYILEKERERLLQQLEFERDKVHRQEREQKKLLEQLEEERAHHKQLSSTLAKECKWASQRALEEGHRLAEAGRRLEKEQGEVQALRAELQDERRRALQMEARVEEQLAEFDTEREQLRSRLKREEARYGQLQEQVEALRKELRGGTLAVDMGETRAPPADAPLPPQCTSQTEAGEEHKVNGHHGYPGEDTLAERLCQDNWSENVCPVSLSPALPTQRLSPCSTGSSSLTSSPCSSPQLAKQLALACSPSYQSSYQAGINQRFHAARHKFQGHAEPEQQQQGVGGGGGGGSLPQSPRDLSPSPSPSPEPIPIHSQAKQLARSTVTQVLSRFTVQQGARPPPPNSSPFGTDYRNLAPPSPVIPRAPGGAPPPGVRSPSIPRADRGNPPPIPPKKPGLAQSPVSPVPAARSSHFPELSGSCGLSSSQENVKERDMVVSSSS